MRFAGAETHPTQPSPKHGIINSVPYAYLIDVFPVDEWPPPDRGLLVRLLPYGVFGVQMVEGH
jgi:hypothetical protein